MLSDTKLLRLRIEKAVYKDGINVALANAEKTKQYKSFKRDLQAGLVAQIENVATEEKIYNLLLFTKRKDDPLITQIGYLVAQKTISMFVNFKDFLTFAGTEGGQALIDKLGIEGIFGVTNPELLQYFENQSNLLIDSVDHYTAEWIANKIKVGKDSGLTPQQIASTLIDNSKKISKARAERITLTELAKGMSTVELQAARRYGITQVIWRTSLDERVCPICGPLEGEQTTIGDDFIGGYLVPAHPSCRCFYEEVIPVDWQIPSDPWLGQ